MHSLFEDIRPTLRSLLAHPSLTLTSVLTLGLGIGVATALFAVVSAVLLRPLPWPEAEGLVQLSEHHPGGQGQIRAPMLSDLTARPWVWQGNAATLEGIAAWSQGKWTVRRGDELERVSGAEVSPELFGLLRAQPAHGRLLLPEDALDGAPPVVLLSDSYWRERFGGDPSAVGQTLAVDGTPRQIVGVTKSGFAFPKRETCLYVPYPVPLGGEGSITVFGALGRLRPGVTPAQAAAEGTAAARGVTRPMVADVLYGKGGPVEVEVRRYQDQLTAPVRPALWVLSVGVGLLLLVAAANVGNLLLTHGFARQRELAVRTALGAGRRRIVANVLLESVLLATGGGVFGLVLALLLLKALPILAPAGFPRLEEVRMSWGVGGFALCVALLTGLLAGLVPALRVSEGELSGRLRDGDKGATAGRGRRLRNGLLVIEAALSLVLLVGAGLLSRSFVRLLAVDPGYNPERVLTARLVLEEAHGDSRVDNASVAALLERLRSFPGVEAAGVGNMMPMGGMTAVAGLSLPWPGADGQPAVASARLYDVTPGFAEALGLRLREGRLFTTSDGTVPDRLAMLVNEAFARNFLPRDRAALGLEIPELFGETGTVAEIVGVVGNVLKEGLDAEARPEIFRTTGRAATWPSEVALVVRMSGEATPLATELPRLVREIDPRLVADAIAPLERLVAESVSKPRFAMAVLVAFSTAALGLAAIGLYGALSYAVALRHRELGVRAALGADRAALSRLILSQGLGVTAAGAAAGLAMAAGASRLMQSLLFGITAWDATAFAAAPLLLLLVATAASLVPARRAAASDPAVVLRGE